MVVDLYYTKLHIGGQHRVKMVPFLQAKETSSQPQTSPEQSGLFYVLICMPLVYVLFSKSDVIFCALY